jgi:hypothetical protein
MLGSAERAARGLRALVVLVPLAGIGCGQPPVERPASISAEQAPPAEPTGDDAPKSRWEACYSTFAPAGDAAGDLARLVRDCGPQGGMRSVTKVRTGKQSEQDPVDRYMFSVPEAGRCYRIYAAADAAVKDLDLLVRGPSGAAVVADVTHDSWPVVPPREPVCFSEPGLYMLEVSVYKGSGRYALQIWGR